jgi:hypothetical protein
MALYDEKTMHACLLVAALHGALALVEVDSVAVVVGKDLDLNVARVVNVLLHDEAIVTERSSALYVP